MTKRSDAADVKLNHQKIVVRVLEAHVHLRGDMLEPHKRFESTNCVIEVMTRKVADAQCNISVVVTGLKRGTVRSYDSICQEVDGALV